MAKYTMNYYFCWIKV